MRKHPAEFCASPCVCCFLPSGLYHIKYFFRLPSTLFFEHPVEFREEEPTISVAPRGFTVSHSSHLAVLNSSTLLAKLFLPVSGCIYPRGASTYCLLSPLRCLSVFRFQSRCLLYNPVLHWVKKKKKTRHEFEVCLIFFILRVRGMLCFCFLCPREETGNSLNNFLILHEILIYQSEPFDGK